MHHIFIGLGGTGVQVWQALERRRQIGLAGAVASGQTRPRRTSTGLAPAVLLIDTDASLHDDEAPSWCLGGRSLAPPRAQRLLLASPQFEAQQALVQPALSTVVGDTRAGGDAPCTVHLVAHPGEPVGAGLLLGVLDALGDLLRPDRAQVQLHLTLSESSPVLAALQHRATATPPGFDRCWLTMAAATPDHERQAQWLLHAGQDGAPHAAGAPRGEFAFWGVAEQRCDLVAVQRHLGHALLLRLLAQLRFDHWRPGLGYVHQAAAVRAAAEQPAAEGDWLSPAAAPQDWQRLAAHYLQLVQHCAPARRRGELRQLFALGVSERFGGAGVAAVFGLSAAVLQQRAADRRAQVEAALWHDWRCGRLSLRDCVAQLAARTAHLSAQQTEAEGRQARDDRLVASLRLQIDAEATLPVAPGGWFRLGADDLHPFALRLQAWAQATTAQAHTTLVRRQLAALQAELTALHAMAEATDLALAALAREADATVAVALAPDYRAPVQALCHTWVTGETVQRESVAYLRAGLFTRLGEEAGFRTLAQQISEHSGCARLLAACTQRLVPSVVASAAQAAVLALARGWQDDPAARHVALQRLRAQAGCGAWVPGPADAACGLTATTETLLLPAALVPPLRSEESLDPAEAQRAATQALQATLQAEAVPWPVGTVQVRLADAQGPASEGPTWLRVVAPVSLAVLAGLAAVPHTGGGDRPDSRPGLLLGEALGLVREDLGAGVVLVRLDSEGFEADRVRLGADWEDAATGMAEPVRCWLQADVDAALRSASIRPDRLRDVVQRRVAQVLAEAPPDAAADLGQRWPAAARVAMTLLSP